MTDDHPPWFAVMTNPKSEAKADMELRRSGFRTFYPFDRFRRRRTRPGTRKVVAEWVEKPHFNRYIFVCIPHHRSIYEVNETNGVSTVVYLGEKPLRIPDAVMDELMDRGDERGVIVEIDELANVERARLAPGTPIRFAENSPFAGLISQVSIDTGKAVRVWLEILGVEREVAVSPSMVAEITA